MLSKEELLKHSNYLLTSYQLEIYRELSNYMSTNNLSQTEVAEKLGVSSSYVSQILNGNFNFTLKKLIQLGIMIGKVPALEFINEEEYWRRDQEGIFVTPTISVNINVAVHILPVQHVELINFSLAEFGTTGIIASGKENISVSENELCEN